MCLQLRVFQEIKFSNSKFSHSQTHSQSHSQTHSQTHSQNCSVDTRNVLNDVLVYSLVTFKLANCSRLQLEYLVQVWLPIQINTRISRNWKECREEEQKLRVGQHERNKGYHVPHKWERNLEEFQRHQHNPFLPLFFSASPSV